MRVLAVAKVHEFGGAEVEVGGQRAGSVDLFKSGADGGVVIGGGAEGFLGETPAGFGGELAGGGAELFSDGGVVGGRDNHRDAGVILGCRADHGGATDIDILHRSEVRRDI